MQEIEENNRSALKVVADKFKIYPKEKQTGTCKNAGKFIRFFACFQIT